MIDDNVEPAPPTSSTEPVYDTRPDKPYMTVKIPDSVMEILTGSSEVAEVDS